MFLLSYMLIAYVLVHIVDSQRKTMAKKDKKSKNVEKKARVAAKQTKKATQKERKERTREKDDSNDDDLDLETVLAEYEKNVSLWL